MIGDETGELRRFELEGSAFQTREVIAPEHDAAGCSVYAIVLANLDRRGGDEVVVSQAGDDGDCVSGGRLEVYRLAKP